MDIIELIFITKVELLREIKKYCFQKCKEIKADNKQNRLDFSYSLPIKYYTRILMEDN